MVGRPRRSFPRQTRSFVTLRSTIDHTDKLAVPSDTASADCALVITGTFAAHIVPPPGARGLNSAASHIYYLYHALVDHYMKRDDNALDGYSQKALARVWKGQRFSSWMTTLLHRFPESSALDIEY